MPLILNQDIAQHPSYDGFGLCELLYDIREYAHPHVSVASSHTVKGQRALIATQAIPANSVIFVYTSEIAHLRTRTSIQIGADEHLEAGEFGSFTNHSCYPNAIVRGFVHYGTDIGTGALINIVPVAKGEEITFDYATTETDLTDELQRAQCCCGSVLCRGRVQSFVQLNAEEQQKLIDKNLIADHIGQLYARTERERCLCR